MFDKVIETIKQFDMLKKGDSVVIGLSGGADSVTLAHILLRLREKYSLELSAVHINHNIRAEGALNDQHFVENFCEKYSLPLKVYSLDIKGYAEKNSLTLEEAGRQCRYKAFKEANADKTAVAHNLNDNAETMIMRLCRGTGLKGMGGILPVRDDIIRPLIMCSRSEIEQYCEENSLSYCTDETNLETEYTRNKIRHLILPVLEEINPGAISILGKNAFLFRQENELIEKIADEAYKKYRKDNTLDVEGLLSAEPVIRYRVFRQACEDAVGLKDIAFEHIEIIDSLLDKPSGKRVDLPKGLSVVKDGGSLAFVKRHKSFDIEIKTGVPVNVNGRNYLLSKDKLPDRPYIGIKCDTDGEWRIRTRLVGDIFMRGDGRRIKLKKFFNDKKIPVSKRDEIMLLAKGNFVYFADGIKNKFKEEDIYLYVWEE